MSRVAVVVVVVVVVVVDIDAQAVTPGEWQCGVRRLAVANGPNIFQMLLFSGSMNAALCDLRYVAP